MKTKTVILIGLAVFLLALLSSSVIKIGPDEIGVRTDNFGLSSRGIVQKDFSPGWHLNIPFIHTWNVFPARIRRVEMTKDPRFRSELGTDALLVQSSDGDRVMVDIHVFFRIMPGKAHLLLQDSGLGDSHVRVLSTLAKDRMRGIFGSLQTEQFYDAQARQRKEALAVEELKTALAPRHIEVIRIMVQDVEFEPRYEQKIKEKKLADQKVELNKAQARAAVERAQVNRIRADTERQVRLIEASTNAETGRIRAEAQKYSAEKRAEANLYRDQLLAEGQLAIAQAEARVTRAKTRVMGGSGGANLAAIEAVKNLKVESISFPTGGRDWFDVRDMATRLGARQ